MSDTKTGLDVLAELAAAKHKKPPRPKRRPQRWEDAVSRAVDAVAELIDLQQEYNDWKDNLPEKVHGTAMYEKLEAISDLDLEGAADTINSAEGIDLPRGYGRD